MGDAVDQIVLLIGTNDIGKDVPMSQALTNLESVIQSISRDYPLSQIKASFYSASSSRGRIQTDSYIRTNEKIKAWNQAYQELASAYMQVEYVSAFEELLDQEGQLKSDYTTDGLTLAFLAIRLYQKP